VAERDSAQTVDFQCALNPLRVARLDARGGVRVDLRELSMQGGPATFGGFGSNSGTQGRIGCGHRRKATQQGAEIQPGAADQNRQSAAREDIGKGGASIAGEICRRIGLPGFTQVHKVMPDTRLLLRIWLGRADIQPTIDQGRIHADNLAPQLFRPFQR